MVIFIGFKNPSDYMTLTLQKQDHRDSIYPVFVDFRN